jgi:exodeoxyribonuclease-3
LTRLFEQHGWIDSYRALQPEGQDYTWWSQRGAARAKNVGWRIDYQVVSPNLRERLKSCQISAEPKFSDHAPYAVDFHEQD